MTKEIEQIEINITCPICNKTISELWVAKLDSVIGVRYAYICSNCENLLKLSKEKIPDINTETLLLFPATAPPK
jgi:transcription elongation factor Elf1